MRASEILRKLADVIDSAENTQPEVHSIMPQQAIDPSHVPDVEQKPALVVVKVDNKDTADDNTMASPLQQELELLKKAAGVPSAFDGQQQ
jgi:hypothetical protein